MKQLTILFLLVFAISCSKDDECTPCNVIIETNAMEASNRCQGLANNYPQGFTTTQNPQVFCGRIPSDKSEQKEICSGVFATTRTKYRCN